MSNFYANVSDMWKKSATVSELNEAFKPFFDLGVDLTILENIEPIFDKKTILDKNGQLFISGYYPTSPSIFTFERGYMKESGQWKLSAFFANIKPVDENK